MTFPTDLVHFTASEFRRPDLIDPAALYFLDAVRSRYGTPLEVTSDARTLAEETALPAHAEPPASSLHVAIPELDCWGRAFDLRWTTDSVARWGFCRAVFDTADALGVSVEFEIVPGPTEPHWHVGLFRDTRPSRVLVTIT